MILHSTPIAQACSGFGKDALDQFLGDAGDAFAFFGRNALHRIEALAEKRFALVAKTIAEIVDDRSSLESGAPGFELHNVFGNDSLSTRYFRLARALVLLYDFAKVIDVVEKKVVEIGRLRCYVAGHAQIDHKHGPSVSRAERTHQLLACQNRTEISDRSHDDIRRRKCAFERLPRNRLASHSNRKISRAFERAIHDAQAANAAIAQMLNHLFSNFSRTENQGRAAFQVAEHALGQLHSRERNGHGPCANLGLRTDTLAYFERALKCTIENRPGCAMFERAPVRRPNLAQNLRFAE